MEVEEKYIVEEAEKRTLFEECYGALRNYSRGQMRHERVGHTLDATSVVNEAYIRMVSTKFQLGRNDDPTQKKIKFRAFACKLIWRVYVDYSRYLTAGRRGGNNRKETLDPFRVTSRDMNRPEFHLELAEALDLLVSKNKKTGAALRELVELSCYGNHSIDELASHFGVTRRTIESRKATIIAFFQMELE